MEVNTDWKFLSFYEHERAIKLAKEQNNKDRDNFNETVKYCL